MYDSTLLRLFAFVRLWSLNEECELGIEKDELYSCKTTQKYANTEKSCSRMENKTSLVGKSSPYSQAALPRTTKPPVIMSVTKAEINHYWRMKRIIEEDHLLAAEKAAARIRTKVLKAGQLDLFYSEEDYRRFEESLKEMLDGTGECKKEEKMLDGTGECKRKKRRKPPPPVSTITRRYG